jgi:preprotein translocase subunit SecF
MMLENNKLSTNVEHEKCFILKNGRVLKNLYELTNSLASMDDETFKHHVNKEKNDFANWIRHVFEDEKLANQISELKTRESMIKKINKRISKINKEKKKKIPFFEKRQKTKKPEAAKVSASHFKDESKEKVKSVGYNKELSSKVDEILLKEKEIEKREQKIQEIEERIEKKLAKEKQTNNKEAKFFSKEFVQGLVTGLLITLILSLIYIKFYY